ncbi:MAG: hypothetical protein ABIV28_00340 [Longimicrobiales bacterium]
MLTLFWFALVLGGGLALFSLAGDFFGSEGADHIHIEHDGADSHWQLFSLRAATYFLFAFGAVGVLVHFTSGGKAPLLAFFGALFTGIVSAFTSVAMFRYLKQTNSGAMETDASFEGLLGHVVLPLRGGRGKIAVERSGREIELMAECYDKNALQPETWKQVVVVEIRGGTAFVSPLHEFERADALLPSETE